MNLRIGTEDCRILGVNPIAPSDGNSARFSQKCDQSEVRDREVPGDGLRAKIAVEGASGGGEATITFDLSDAAGKPVEDLQPYMGAMGHLVVLSGDGKEYVHAHPAEAKPGTSSRVVFRAHIMKPGLYKGWGQFRRMDTVRVVPFVFKVG